MWDYENGNSLVKHPQSPDIFNFDTEMRTFTQNFSFLSP